MLADSIVKRWQDHLPLHRLEDVYARDGLELARSTMCGWHAALAEVVAPLIAAVREDAFTQPYLCVDATGVLVQQKESCTSVPSNCFGGFLGLGTLGLGDLHDCAEIVRPINTRAIHRDVVRAVLPGGQRRRSAAPRRHCHHRAVPVTLFAQ
jgi:hypothetical protein